MNTRVPADGQWTADPRAVGRLRRSLWKGPALVAGLALLFPVVGSQLVHDWRWRPMAFVVFGALIFGIALTYRLITWKHESLAYRAAVGIACVTGFFLAWGNLVQSADVTPAAALYFGVFPVGLVGAVVARLRPRGMAWALFIMAIVQATLVMVLLLLQVIHEPQIAFWTPPQVRGLVGNALFSLLFATSAGLFRKAGRDEANVLPASLA